MRLLAVVMCVCSSACVECVPWECESVAWGSVWDCTLWDSWAEREGGWLEWVDGWAVFSLFIQSSSIGGPCM